MDSDAKTILAFAFGLVIGAVAVALAGLPEAQQFFEEINEIETAPTDYGTGLLPVYAIMIPLVLLFGFVALVFRAVNIHRAGHLPPKEEVKDGPG